MNHKTIWIRCKVFWRIKTRANRCILLRMSCHFIIKNSLTSANPIKVKISRSSCRSCSSRHRTLSRSTTGSFHSSMSTSHWKTSNIKVEINCNFQFKSRLTRSNRKTMISNKGWSTPSTNRISCSTRWARWTTIWQVGRRRCSRIRLGRSIMTRRMWTGRRPICTRSTSTKSRCQNRILRCCRGSRSRPTWLGSNSQASTTTNQSTSSRVPTIQSRHLPTVSQISASWRPSCTSNTPTGWVHHPSWRRDRTAISLRELRWSSTPISSRTFQYSIRTPWKVWNWTSCSLKGSSSLTSWKPTICNSKTGRCRPISRSREATCFIIRTCLKPTSLPWTRWPDKCTTKIIISSHSQASISSISEFSIKSLSLFPI